MAALAPGAFAGALLMLVIGSAAAGLILAAEAIDPSALWRDRYVLGVLVFTVWQAGLSAVLSVALAVPVARAMARRRRFAGRGLLLRLMALPMVVPTIVGALGVVAVYGRSGWINDGLDALGIGVRLDIYGLAGILIAHVFFNMPFAVRLLLHAWSAVPGETWRLAGQLGMTSGQIFRLIEWPMLRQTAPGIAGLVFLLCVTSFTVVLALGGGPPNATFEVAIYQSLRFDFDLGRVLLLATLQVTVCAVLLALLGRAARPMAVEATTAYLHQRPDGTGLWSRILDAAAIGLALAVLTLPLAAIAVVGLAGPVLAVLGDAAVWQAVLRSVVVGSAAGTLALMLGAGLVLTSRTLRVAYRRPGAADTIDLAGSLILVVPPFVIGAGLFVLLRGIADVFALGLVLVVVVNALMGLPFVIRILGPAAVDAAARHDRLCASLGIAGWHRLRLIDWPLLRKPAALALALCTALSLGDLGVIALFGTPDSQTLPLLLYQLMGAYRLGEAAVVALVLLALCLGLFVLIERGMGGRGDR